MTCISIHQVQGGQEAARGGALVEHVAQDLVPGGHQGERARGGHAQRGHRLAGDELAQAAAHHRAPVRHAAVLRRARALRATQGVPVEHALRQSRACLRHFALPWHAASETRWQSWRVAYAVMQAGKSKPLR